MEYMIPYISLRVDKLTLFFSTIRDISERWKSLPSPGYASDKIYVLLIGLILCLRTDMERLFLDIPLMDQLC